MAIRVPSRSQLQRYGYVQLAPCGVVQPDEFVYNVSVEETEVVVSVERVNGSSNAATVHYSTVDGTAVAGTHYTATSGTLSWMDDEEGVKTFTVGGFYFYAASKTFTILLTKTSGCVTVEETPISVVLSGRRGILINENDFNLLINEGGGELLRFEDESYDS